MNNVSGNIWLTSFIVKYSNGLRDLMTIHEKLAIWWVSHGNLKKTQSRQTKTKIIYLSSQPSQPLPCLSSFHKHHRDIVLILLCSVMESVMEFWLALDASHLLLCAASVWYHCASGCHDLWHQLLLTIPHHHLFVDLLSPPTIYNFISMTVRLLILMILHSHV